MTADVSSAAGHPGATQTRRFRVSRQRPADARPHFDEFDIEVGPDTTLLDALREIRSHHDKSLTLRYSCCHASCGTCGMRANGQEVLACVTKLTDLGPGPILVEPLANARVEHDLVVDMRDLYESLEPASRPLIRQDNELAGYDVIAAGHEGPEFARFEDCIECGLCLSACPIVATDSRYLGPAALAAAWRSVQEPRGADPGSVLDWVDDEQGCWRCHASFECTEVCPSGVDPAAATMALRRELTKRRLGSIARLGRRQR